MWQILKTLLSGRNDFASGGLVLMIVGAVSMWLRAVPEMIWDWFVRQTTMTVTVTDGDMAFTWVKEWFLDQAFMKRVRRVDLDTKVRDEPIAMMPAPGKHWFWYHGRPFEVWFSRTEKSTEAFGVSRRLESLTFRAFGRDRAVLQRFVDDILRSHEKRHGAQSRLYVYNDGWDWLEGYDPRLIDSVILRDDDKELLLEDMARFRRSKTRYQSLGVPYHRGYLFHGPPGTGKTSLVSALGGHFGLSIYTVNLAEFTDRSLAKAVGQVPSDSILLFEDIDCMGGSKARAPRAEAVSTDAKESSGANVVTLSGLLNVLDGFLAPAGVMFAMTTNRIEQLDAALLRAGRIDYKLYLGKACDRQKLELYARFFPNAGELDALAFVEASRSAETMAEVQGLLLSLEQSNDRRALEEVSS